MREIKFRAWDIKGQVMIDWNCMCQTAFNRGDAHLLYDVMTGPGVNFIRLQYTGLKDRNGREIYEGDILRFYISEHKSSVEKYDMDPKRWDFICSFENGCFGYKGPDNGLHHIDDLKFRPFYDYEDGEMQDMSDIKIIGNIYENPELISEGTTETNGG